MDNLDYIRDVEFTRFHPVVDKNKILDFLKDIKITKKLLFHRLIIFLMILKK